MGGSGSSSANEGGAARGVDPIELDWDAKALRAVADDGFTGPLYDKLIDRLIRYALPVMRGLVRSGRIFAECYRRNNHIKIFRPVSWAEQDQEDLALQAVAAAVRRFHYRTTSGRGWRRDGGATLATYFAGMCIDEFPNQFRAWLDKHKKRIERELPLEFRSVDDRYQNEGVFQPEDAVIAREAAEHSLRPLTPMQRRAVVMDGLGFTRKEIAHNMGLSVRAVEGLVRRGRERKHSGEGRS